MSIPVHNLMAFARAQGAPWETINEQLTAAQQAHIAAGGDYWEMVSKMGFQDPKMMRDRMMVERMMDKASGLAQPVSNYYTPFSYFEGGVNEDDSAPTADLPPNERSFQDTAKIPAQEGKDVQDLRQTEGEAANPLNPGGPEDSREGSLTRALNAPREWDI